MNKICTNIDQSQKLIELEIDINTADMVYVDCEYLAIRDGVLEEGDILAWSLVALLNILPDDTNVIKDKSDTENEKYMCTVGVKDDIISTFGNNPVDACYEMIISLHELNLL